MKIAFAAILLCVKLRPVRAELNPRARCLAEATAFGVAGLRALPAAVPAVN